MSLRVPLDNKTDAEYLVNLAERQGYENDSMFRNEAYFDNGDWCFVLWTTHYGNRGVNRFAVVKVGSPTEEQFLNCKVTLGSAIDWLHSHKIERTRVIALSNADKVELFKDGSLVYEGKTISKADVELIIHNRAALMTNQ